MYEHLACRLNMIRTAYTLANINSVCGRRELKRRKLRGGGHSITKIVHQVFRIFSLTLKH